MTAIDLLLVLIWLAVTAYAVLAGADFGAGLWDLVAGGNHRGARRRELIEHVIGPVWEANHVWLIFVLVLAWTSFPTAFASIASTLWIPLTLAAIGIIGRGAAFAFRKAVTSTSQRRLFGAVFATSSVLTPFFLGTVAGAIAGGDVPPGIAAGDPVRSWTSPVAVLCGCLAVTACGFLAATYLCGDARRQDADTEAWFHRVALLAGLVTGAVALAGLLVTAASRPSLFDALTGPGLPGAAVSVAGGVATLLLVGVRRYAAARITAGLAVAGLVWGWGLAQRPMLLPGLTAAQAAATSTTLHAVLVTSLVGLVLLAPSLAWLLRLAQPGRRPAPRPTPTPTATATPSDAAAPSARD